MPLTVEPVVPEWTEEDWEQRPVRILAGLFSHLFVRTWDGRKIRCEWYGPDELGFYQPVFYTEDDGKILVDRGEYEALKDAAWRYMDLCE